MRSIQTKQFQAGNSQAIRLPKDFAYPENTPLILSKENGVITIRPLQDLSQVTDLFAKIGEKFGSFERVEFEANERDW